jgi:hypothetical protein
MSTSQGSPATTKTKVFLLVVVVMIGQSQELSSLKRGTVAGTAAAAAPDADASTAGSSNGGIHHPII